MYIEIVPYQQIALGRTADSHLQAPTSWVMPAKQSMDVRDFKLLFLKIAYKTGSFAFLSDMPVRFSLEESADGQSFKTINASVITINQRSYDSIVEISIAGTRYLRARFDSIDYEGIFQVKVSGHLK